MHTEYRLHPFLSEFYDRRVERRFRSAEFNARWLAVLIILAISAEILTYFLVDSAVFPNSYAHRLHLLISHIVIAAVDVILLIVHLIRPSVKKNDNIALLFVVVYSIKYSWTALYYGEHLGRTNNPYIFSIVTLLILTVIPFALRRALVAAGGLVAAAFFVNVRGYLDGGDPVVLFSFVIMMLVSVSFGVAFSYYFQRARRLRFAHAEIAENLAIQLGEEVERRKDAEVLLEKQNEQLERMVEEKVGELRESEFRFRTLAQALPGVVLELNQEGSVEDCNANAEYIFAAGESLRGVFFSKRFLGSEDVAAFHFACENVLHNNKSAVLETMIRFSEDVAKVYSWSFAAIRRNDEGFVVALGQDVTVLKNTQQLMIQSEKMLSLGGLAAGLAHELNSPLAGIQQSIQVIKQRLTPNEKNEDAARKWDVSLKQVTGYLRERRILELCDMIERASVRSSTIVQDMLDFARQRDRMTMEPLADVVDAALRLAQTDYSLNKKFHIKDIRIEKQYESSRLCLCDKTALSQVFFNIFVNGAHAMGEEADTSKEPLFKITLSDTADSVEITIADNGPGIEKSRLSRIFEPFYTTKEAGKGTGLGLSISYFIVTEGHRGTIRVSSELQQGTTFIINIPFGADETAMV